MSAPYRLVGEGGETEPSQSVHVCELVPVKNVQNSRDSWSCVGKARSGGVGGGGDRAEPVRARLRAGSRKKRAK